MSGERAFVLPVYKGFWEQGVYPGAEVDRGVCGHLVWVIAEVASQGPAVFICVECAMATLADPRVRHRLSPGVLDRIEQENPECAERVRRFIARYNIRE